MQRLSSFLYSSILSVLVASSGSLAFAQDESLLWENDGATWVPGVSRLPDFTNVGYLSGSVAIPNWPVGVDVTAPPYNAIPNDGIDDSQAFIDAIAACPDNHAVYVPDGRYTILQQIVPDNDYFVLRGESMYGTVLHFPKYLNEIYIQEVGFENPAYFLEGNGYRHKGIGKGFIRMEGGTHRSIENLTFEFREQRKMGHWEHKGASAIWYGDEVEDSWVRNIHVLNGDNTFMMGRAERISYINIIFDHFIGRPDIIGSGSSHRFVGHIGLGLSNIHYCLFHNIEFTGNYFHELDIINVPQNCVSSNFKGSDLSLHHHGGGASKNLYTNANVGNNGGIGSLGNTQSNETHWRIYGNSTLEDPLPADAMDKGHIFVGYDSNATTFSDIDDWVEAIDPATLYPDNIYLAQLQHPSINKPLPEGPPAPPPGPSGNLIRINPIEDTVTDAGAPDTSNAGTNKTLEVGDDMYFKFDLNNLSLASIEHVRFRVASTKFANTPVTLAVYSITDDSWADNTLTYNAAQLLPTAQLQTIVIHEDSEAQILEFDVTSFVQSEWASDKVVSLAIKRIEGSGFLSGIRSSEMGIAPELVIEQIASAVPGAPSAPTEIRSESRIGNIILNWPDNPEADIAYYNVYRSTSPKEFRLYEEPIGMGLLTSDFVDVQHNHGTGWDIGMMRDDTVYYYRVTAVDEHDYESESSIQVLGTVKGYLDDNLPPAFNSYPVVLANAAQYLTNVYDLTASVTDPEGDSLYFHKLTGPDWIAVDHDGTVTATPRLGETGTYQFDVQVSGLYGGQDEATIEVTVDAAVPDAPLIVDIVPNDAGADLDWEHSSEGSASFTFSVYRSTISGGPYEEVATGLTNSNYTDTGLTNGTPYYYVVTATNASGESPNSEEVTTIPIAGITLGTNFLGGDINNAADWDAGLPTTTFGRVEVNGTIQHDQTTGYSVLQTSGTINNASFQGTQLVDTQWNLAGGTFSVRGPTLSGTTTFALSGSGLANFGVNSTDVTVNTGSSFVMTGGTTSLGRSLRAAGGTVTISGGTMTGSANTDLGTGNIQSNGVFNFNGGTVSVNRFDLRGSNTTFNFGGSTAGSVTATDFNGSIGTDSAINFLYGTLVTLTVSGVDEWAETLWAVGDLTYKGMDFNDLGDWATVTSANGLEPGAQFLYDSNTETLSLFTSDVPPTAPTGLFATAGNQQVSLDWDDNGEIDFDSYTVYRSQTVGGPYSSITSGLTASDYVDTGLNQGETYYYVVTATDATANESANSLEVTIIPNLEPAFTVDPITGGDATEDAEYSGTLAGSATDGDDDTLEYAINDGPEWLSVTLDGTLSGTPTNSDVGANAFTIEVSDGFGGTDTATLNITVINTNDAPVFSVDPIAGSDATQDAPYTGTLAGSANDDEGDSLTYNKASGPDWLGVATDGTLSGTPDNDDVGANAFIIEVSDGNTGTDTATLNITVINVNDAPVFTVDPIAGSDATEDIDYSGSLVSSANDIDNDILTFSKTGGPDWLNVATDGTLSGIPTNDDVGVNAFTVEVTDGEFTDSAALNISVINVNDDPVFSVDPITGSDATEDAEYSGTLAGSATDDESDPLTYSKTAGPDWLNVATDGTLSGTPTNEDVGANAFTIEVSDGNTGTDTATLNITVINTNDDPVFSIDPITGSDATEDAAYSGTLAGSATDDDVDDTLTYTKTDGSDWLNVATDGTLTGTPSNDDVGANAFTIEVSDGNTGTDTATLNITVNNTNDAPVFAADPIVLGNGIEDVAYNGGTLAGSATDDDGDTLEYSKTSGPAWLSVAIDGTLTGTPANSDIGLNSFTIEVTDNNGGTDTATLEITVTEPQTVFLGGDLAVAEDWTNGLPTSLANPGIVAEDGIIQPGAPVTYFITQTAGTISNADFNGTTLSGGVYNLQGGTLNVRGLSLASGSSAVFNVNESGYADLGNNSKDVIINAGTSFNVLGGTVTLGRNIAANSGGTFTITGGTLTGSSGTLIGTPGFQSNGVFNFNGGTTEVNSIQPNGSNVSFNFGGSTPGSLTANGFNGSFGSGTTINFLPGTKMALTISAEDEWAETLWAAGDLTYNGLGTGDLGTWAAVSAVDGLEPGVQFVYDSNTETLTVSGDLPPSAPQNLAANTGDQQITLDWDDNGEADLDSYTVFRSETMGGPYSSIASSLATSDYLDTGLINGTTYYYVVTATDAGLNESENSTEAFATPTGDPDTDDDGIDDAWEILYFGSTGAIDGTADSDGDGDADFLEYLYGSIPTDATSNGFSMLVAPVAASTMINFDWVVNEGFVFGNQYHVLFSSDLVMWDAIPGAIYTLQEVTADGKTNVTLEVDRSTVPECYIRISVPVSP